MRPIIGALQAEAMRPWCGSRELDRAEGITREGLRATEADFARARPELEPESAAEAGGGC